MMKSWKYSNIFIFKWNGKQFKNGF